MSLSRFQGCLVGAVIADCIGALYEGVTHVRIRDVLDTVTDLETKYKEKRKMNHGFQYTDDTAMTRSVARSLIEKKEFDADDMAFKFQKEYFSEPTRGYGGNIVNVFEGLRDPNLKDVYKPASEQFDGSGSYGNGGSMRIAPAALFTFRPGTDNTSELVSLVSSITRLTHSHHLAINGAILQALAIDQSLQLLDKATVNASGFIDSLISKMKPIEEQFQDSTRTKKSHARRKLDDHPTPYSAKLERIKELLELGAELKARKVVEDLGTDISAVGSVPAAILCFLRAATQPIPELDGRNRFEQTVLYAISLGGDTDTVATMAAAIAGALYGMEMVPEAWQHFCEGVKDAKDMAEKLFKKGDNAGDGGVSAHTSNANVVV